MEKEEEGKKWKHKISEETRGEMEGERGRNWKMNEKRSDKKSCF